MVASTTVLAEMAKFLIFLSGAPSYWFSLDKSCDSEFHLAKRFGMDKTNFEALLIAGNLAQHTKKGGSLSILADQWTSFLGGHHFSDLFSDPPSFEFERKKIRINNQKTHITYVVRIGRLTDQSPLKFEKQLKANQNPPRMNSLRIQQQAFGRATDLAIANVRVRMKLHQQQKDEKKGVMAPPTTEAPAQAPSSPAKEIVPTPTAEVEEKPMMLGQQIPAEQRIYPLLREIYGDAFDPLSEETKKKVEPLLAEIIRLMGGASRKMNVTDHGGHKNSYIRVPRSSSDLSFNNTKLWIDKALEINGSPHNGTFESAYRVANHLCRFYGDSVRQALKKQGWVIAEKMYTVKYVAMLSSLKISGAQERILARYLKEHFGKSFCPTQTAVGELTNGHADVQTGTKLWTYQGKDIEETVEWWELDLDIAIAQRLQRELLSCSTSPSDVVNVQAVVGGDHGNTAFQFGAAVTAKLQSGDEVHFELISSELICRKDTAALIEATILPKLTKGLETISKQTLHIYEQTGDNQLVCTFDLPPPEINDVTKIKIKTYSTGDLAYQLMTQGREGMSGAHCMICQLTYKEFNDDRAKVGKLWTFEELTKIANEVISTRNGEPLMGVKQHPWWPFLECEHQMVPLLHCLIGIGNNLLDKFCDMIKVYCEKLSPEEVLLARQVATYEHIIKTTALERDEFDCSPDGKKLKSLQGMITSRKRKVKAKDNTPPSDNDAAILLAADIKIKEEEIKPLLTIRRTMVDRLKATRSLLTEKEKALRSLRSSKATSPNSLESQVFKVLKRIGVEQSSYHGGSLNGKDIKKVMNNAAYLFDDFSSLLQAGKREGCELDNGCIDALCQHFKLVFLLWDGAFSLARKKNPTEMDAEQYQRFIDAAVSEHVNLGLTITPKVHLMFHHVKWQMVNIEGGLGDKMEDWIEKLHQVGMQLRARYRTTKNLQKRAAARIRLVHRDTTPAVINQTLQVGETSKRKFTATMKSEEGGGDNSGERWAKRMKAFDDRESITKKSEYARVLSGLKSDSKAIKTEDSRGGEGSASEGGGGEESCKRVRARPRRYDE